VPDAAVTRYRMPTVEDRSAMNAPDCPVVVTAANALISSLL
jgi:hypothetical protein